MLCFRKDKQPYCVLLVVDIFMMYGKICIAVLQPSGNYGENTPVFMLSESNYVFLIQAHNALSCV